MRLSLICLAIAFMLAPGDAAAQGWPGRVLIGVNGAMQLTASTFDDEFTYLHPYSGNIPGEEVRVETRYEIPTGALFDAGAAVRLFGNFGVGVSASFASSTNDIEIDARIPHPFYIAQHREVTGTIPARHVQRGVHIQAVYLIPATEHLYVGLSGGPSYFSIEQRVVNTVSVSESYPFDTAEFVTADLGTLTEAGWGFNAAVDVGWMFNQHFGVGGQVRYSQATLSVAPSGREARDIEAGGVHVGIGARIGF